MKVVACVMVTALAAVAWGQISPVKYPRYVFAVGSAGVQVYAADSTTGTLRLSKIITSAGGLCVAMHPNGRFIYFGGYGIVEGYSVKADGSLLSLPGSPYSAPGSANLTAISVSHSGKLLAVTDSEFNSVWSYLVDVKTGALTLAPGAPFTSGPGGGGVTIARNSKFLYVSNQGSNSVSAFTINSTNAALTEITGSPFSLSAGNTVPAGLVNDTSGKYLYVSGTKGVDGFSINSLTGALKLIAGSPFAGAGGDSGVLATDPLGTFVYGGVGYGAYVYTINALTGALAAVPGSPFGIWASGIAPDPTGNYLYTSSNGNGNVVRLNRTSGALAQLNSYVNEGFGPIAVSTGATPVTYIPKFAFVANQGDNTVFSYGINATSGVLTKVASTTVGTGPYFVTTDLANRYLYVVNSGADSLSAFAINSGTGKLSQLPGSPYSTGGFPVSAAVDPVSTYVYVANNSTETVSAFKTDPLTGELTNAGSTSYHQNCGAPSALIFSPTAGGSELFAACGELAAVAVPGPPPILVGNGPTRSTSLISDPHGSWAWGVYLNERVEQVGLSQYSIGTQSFGPVGDSLTGGLALEPFGRFLYAMAGGSNDIQGDAVSAGGALSLIQGSPFTAGTSPVAGASDFSGKFLYVLNQGSNDISGYAIDQSTGALTPLTPATFAAGKAPLSIVTTGTFH